jgi:hypothetical protein
LSQLGGCCDEGSEKPDIPDAKCTFIVMPNNHAITAWVNDEPVWAKDYVSTASINVFFPMFHQGMNYVPILFGTRFAHLPEPHIGGIARFR